MSSGPGPKEGGLGSERLGPGLSPRGGPRLEGSAGRQLRGEQGSVGEGVGMRLLRGKGRGREGDGVRRLDLRRGVWGEQGGLRAGRGEQREKNGGLGVGWWWVSRGVAKKSTKYLQKIGVCTLPIQRSFCLPPHAITHTRPTQLLSNICLVTKLVTVGNFHFGPRAV